MWKVNNISDPVSLAGFLEEVDFLKKNYIVLSLLHKLFSVYWIMALLLHFTGVLIFKQRFDCYPGIVRFTFTKLRISLKVSCFESLEYIQSIAEDNKDSFWKIISTNVRSNQGE